MKKQLILALAVALVIGAALGVAAQQSEQRQRFQRYREAQQKAVDAIAADAAKLKAAMAEAAERMRNRGDFQNLSEEERTKLREEFTKRREQRQAILKDIELQVARLKGSRQLRTEHREGTEALEAIKTTAESEKADKTAAAVAKLIETKQAKYEEMLKTLGIEPRQGGRGFGGSRQ